MHYYPEGEGPDGELIEMIELLNKVEPYCFSIVDTFGSMYEEDLQHVYSVIEHNLAPSIKIGFHSHNNMQLSNALSQAFLRMAMQRKAYTEALAREVFPFVIVTKEEREQGGRNFSAVIHEKNLKEELDCAGYFAVISSEENGNADREERMIGLLERNLEKNEAIARRKGSFFDLAAPGSEMGETYAGAAFVADVAQKTVWKMAKAHSGTPAGKTCE